MAQRAFLELREWFFSSKVKQNSANVDKVVVQGTRVDDNVVDVHVHETTAVGEEVIHGALKGTGGIAKSKRHYAEL